MSGSQNNDLMLSVYSDRRTVFTLNDIAMLIDESNFNSLNKRINLPPRILLFSHLPF